MTLIYNGNGEGIAGIPAMDLDDTEIKRLTDVLEISEADLVTLLTSRGLYSVPAQPKKPKTAVAEPAPLENEE
jgi:hypothetical protein